MFLPKLFLMSILLHISDGFTVKGASGPLVVPLGGSVLLPCSVDSLSSLKDLEVEWRRSDSQTLIHLYQDGDIRPEVQNENYHDRAHFFTEYFKYGNFSLLLKNVTAEDEGQYTCTVHSGQESGETVVEIKDVERLIVSGSDQSLSVYVGEDVTLNCSVDSHIPPEDIEEVSWKKTDKDEHITVLLYQNNKVYPEASDEQYTDRVEFFKDEIHRGNFSLRLKRVRTEDKGLYMCQVFAGSFSDNTTVILQQLGLSGLHIMVLILCISACGSALLLCSIIYCRNNNTDTALRLQMSLVFCPNIIMFFAFVFWGVSEGSVNETVLCCTLYIVRPLMLLFTAPYNEQFTGKIETLLNWSLETNYISFTTVVYSVLFKSAWEKSLNYTASERAMIIALFVIVLLLCLIYSINVLLQITVELSQRMNTILIVVAVVTFYVLPSLQFVLLFFTFESATGGFIIVAVLPVITSATRYNWNNTCGDQMGCSPVVRRLVWIVLMCFMNAVLMFFYITALEKENDRVGWACTIGFLQVIWTVWNCLGSFGDWGLFGNCSFVLLGDSVVVPFSINPSLLTESLKVEWRRSDSQTLVHLYQDGAAVQQQGYHKRAYFFTEKIKDGEFSLQLKKVKAEDAGEYTCTVYHGQDSTIQSFRSILELGFVVDCTVVSMGGSVLLPCFGPRLQTYSHKVEWKRSEALVHLYQDGDIRSEEQHQDYHDRAHFFTDNIEHGNLSLRLDHMRAKDEGQYKCEVYSGQRSVFSANTILTLRLIQTVLRLQLFLVFCPNIIMFFAFVFWGVSEGSVIETVSCCSLYIVRPLMLLWAAPYVQQFTGNIKTWILFYSYRTEYIVFSTVLYSVLFYSAWRRGLSYAGFEGIMIIVLFGFVLLFCLFYSIFMFAEISGKLSQRVINIFNVLARIFYDVLPSLQFVLLIYSFGSTRGGLFIVAVLPVILTVTNYNWDLLCGDMMGCSPLVRRSVWSVMMLLVTALMMFFYIMALENEKDRVGWACKIGFLQVLWTVWNFGTSFRDKDFPRITSVYLFGSVGVVLISAFALMTELILKIVNGEGLLGDLRIVVFSLETLFVASLLILLVFATWIKPCLQSCQARAKCK